MTINTISPDEKDQVKINGVIRRLIEESDTFATTAEITAAIAASEGYGTGMANGTFVVSASASALTIALKTLAGTDPSATDIVTVFFRNATGTTGNYVALQVTAATSLVISSGSTLGVTSSTGFRIWIVGFNDGGTFRLGAINCATTVQIFPLVEGLASSTAEGGAGAADSAGVIYTGTAVTTKAMRILGYAEWSSSGLTAGTWTTSNLSAVQLFGPGIKKPNDIVQVVSATVATPTTTTSTSFVDTTLTVTFNVVSAANLFDVHAVALSATGGSPEYGITQLVRDSTQIGVLTNFGLPAGSNTTCAWLALDRPNTAAAGSITYKVQLRSLGGASVTLPGANAVIRVLELMA